MDFNQEIEVDLENIQIDDQDNKQDDDQDDTEVLKAKIAELEEINKNKTKALKAEREKHKKPAKQNAPPKDPFADLPLDQFEGPVKEAFERLLKITTQNTDSQVQDIYMRDLIGKYPDAAEHADAIKERSRKANMTLDEAYFSIKGKELAERSEQDIEQEVKARMSMQPDRLDAGSGPSIITDRKTSLSQDQLEAAARAGLDIESYETLAKNGMKKGGMLLSEIAGK